MKKTLIQTTLFICLCSLMSFKFNLALLQSKGKVTLLRVHDVGTKYGPPSDQIDTEVVFQLDSEPDKAFGFQLRNDANAIARKGMLDVLRDAFRDNRTITIDYELAAGKKNGIVIRTWETR